MIMAYTDMAYIAIACLLMAEKHTQRKGPKPKSKHIRPSAFFIMSAHADGERRRPTVDLRVLKRIVMAYIVMAVDLGALKHASDQDPSDANLSFALAPQRSPSACPRKCG